MGIGLSELYPKSRCLLGQLLLSEPSSNFRRTATTLCPGFKKFRSSRSGNIRPVRQKTTTLPLIDWEERELSCGWGRKKKKKWMTVSIFHSLRRELTCLLTCGRRSPVSGTQNDIVVSWIILRGMIKVYWLDLILAYILDHAVCCASAASSGRSSRLISHLRNEV